MSNFYRNIKFYAIVVFLMLSISFSFKEEGIVKISQSQSSFFKDDYENLIFLKSESIESAAGTKSVLMNSNGTKLYAMNLEGMSVYEFDVLSKKLCRIFKFKATKSLGWDYTTHEKVPSFEEKPVEGCLTNNDEILWVSLHNAKGVVPIHLNKKNYLYEKLDTPRKKIYIKNIAQNKTDSTFIPLIKTGKTPKIIAKTANDKFILVSNWHSNTVSVIEINSHQYPFGKVVAKISVSAIPRGIVVDDKNQKTYIAIMGGNSIIVVNNNTWKIENEIIVSSTPRHIVMDNNNRLFVSYNSKSKVGCINLATNKKIFDVVTNAQPRTIVLSKNKKFLFVTCYGSNMVDVFKINDNSFTKLYSIPCQGKPVGVDIVEDDNKLQAWVCNYVDGNIKIFTFEKKY